MIEPVYHWYQYPFLALPTFVNVILSLAIVAYFIYALTYRIWRVYSETMDEGFFRGLYMLYIGLGEPIYETKLVGDRMENRIVGRKPKYLRLYHLLWMLIDLPCIAIGGCLPFLRKMFNIKLFKVHLPTPEESEE